MAYDRTLRMRTLRFEDGSDFPGLTVEIYGLSVDEWMTTASAKAMTDLFVDRLVSWTFSDPITGEPVPADRDGLGTLDVGEALALVRAWFDYCAKVRPGPPASASAPSPTGGSSTPPDPTFEQSISMQHLDEPEPSTTAG